MTITYLTPSLIQLLMSLCKAMIQVSLFIRVFVQFYEARSGRDLISREGSSREYQVDNIKIVEK
ncbi:hypothetical protein MFLAVUS_001093 [Mucor flavus]|uniref:Uncharacterized protein n=1 Tax=Mucor flavus TaxID=439312 RepID=A0ABP9YLI0_9FUNG